MISGFGSGSSSNTHHHLQIRESHGLPLPFNIPKVLHNLLFEEIGLEFDRKQSDMIETLRFSYTSLIKLQQKYSIKESDLKSKIYEQPDNVDIKNEYKDIQLDRQQANFDFKNIVILMSDMLNRDQMQILLKFSKILK